MPTLNPTHDPTLQSWVPSANDPTTDFPIQNLPFAIFRRANTTEPFRGGVAIGDQILDLAATLKTGALPSHPLEAAAEPTLNHFMALGPAAWSTLRHSLSEALRKDSPIEPQLRSCLVPQSAAEYTLPAVIGDYTDFYTSIHHATAVGKLFRPDTPLLPNYKHLPIGYHGRASSIVPSGTPIRRPCGQFLTAGTLSPHFSCTKKLDYELEIAAFIGPGNDLGSPIPISEAESHIFGLTLLNDWSARDIQSWEYQPLGPFLGKNFATSISPWIITLEALAPFQIPHPRPPSDPPLLPYLQPTNPNSALDIRLEVSLKTSASSPIPLSQSNFRHSYWTFSQLIAHHTVNGCNLRPGDLLASGTQSGPTPSEAGSLLELISSGITPSFLADGDEVIFHAWCDNPSTARRIGFGSLTGSILPAYQSTL